MPKQRRTLRAILFAWGVVAGGCRRVPSSLSVHPSRDYSGASAMRLQSIHYRPFYSFLIILLCWLSQTAPSRAASPTSEPAVEAKDLPRVPATEAKDALKTFKVRP